MGKNDTYLMEILNKRKKKYYLTWIVSLYSFLYQVLLTIYSFSLFFFNHWVRNLRYSLEYNL